MKQTGMKLWSGGSLVSGNIADNGAGAVGTNATGIATSWSPDFPTSATSIVSDTTSIDLTGFDAAFIRILLTGTNPSFDELQLSLMIALYDPMGLDENPTYFAPRIIYLSSTTTPSNQMQAVTAFGTIPAGLFVNFADLAADSSAPIVYPSSEVARSANLAVNGFVRQLVGKYASTNLLSSVAMIPLAGATKMAYRVRVCRIAGSSASVTGVGVRPLYCGVSFDG